MTTYGDFITDVRLELQDTSGNPRWSDDLLYVGYCDAVRDYSEHFPYVVHRYDVSTGVSSNSFSLPDDFNEAIFVEAPEDTYLEQKPNRPGVKFPSASSAFYYWIDGSTLHIDYPTSESVLVTYRADRDLPANSSDTDFVVNFPARDYELIRTYIRAKVISVTRARQALLDRFKLGTGSRTDNPVEPEVENLMDNYLQMVYERKGGKSHHLFTSGRGR